MTPELTTKILAATGHTQTGSIIACAVGQERPAPYFTGKGIITSDGFLMCDFVDRVNQHHMGAFIGHVSSLEENLERVVVHCTLNKEERAELGAAIDAWISQDYRGRPEKFLS